MRFETSHASTTSRSRKPSTAGLSRNSVAYTVEAARAHFISSSSPSGIAGLSQYDVEREVVVERVVLEDGDAGRGDDWIEHPRREVLVPPCVLVVPVRSHDVELV